ncbi:hypothetical protein [Streptomyces cellulosae]|uniref:hypothetical protein n=1 Tax=Streptomyces cellulosae TaxID=1968 RepID=UPI0004C61CFD|nr:hypothetical protein [Streptomyces cellulosae]
MSAGRNRGSDRFATAGRETTAAERTAATRLVTRRARSADDREQLLAALGLDSQTMKDSSS